MSKYLPSIEAKTIHYLCNGSGRDFYINSDNGGVFKAEIDRSAGFEIGTQILLN